MAFDPYDKHYWRFADEYPAIYADDAALALWHRLVRLAGMSWPSAGTLPYGTRKRALGLLVGADLVAVEPGGHFRIRGMDKERTKRQQSARNAANTRWSNAEGNADRIANGNAERNAEVMPSRAEQRESRDSAATDSGVLLSSDDLAAWSDFTHRRWEPFKRAWLDRGFRMPPHGEWDDSKSQRALLWEVADAVPDRLGEWVREAPGKPARSVVDHVLERWHQHKRDAAKRADADERRSEQHRAEPMARLGDLLRGAS